jgi:hypothetical protein
MVITQEWANLYSGGMPGIEIKFLHNILFLYNKQYIVVKYMLFNIYNAAYLVIRLAPFIVVTYFTLLSAFTQDMNGTLFLVGLVLACLVTIQLGTVTRLKHVNFREYPEYCKILDLSEDGAISGLPLGQTVLSYTFFYILFIICKYSLVDYNAGTISILVILIAGDFLWNMTHKCNSINGLVISLIVGGVIGTFWAIILDTNKKILKNDLTDFNNINGNAKKKCRLSKLYTKDAVYKCT